MAAIIPDDTTNIRKALLLAIFCLALFTDAFMTSAMIICLDQVNKPQMFCDLFPSLTVV